MCDQAQVCHSRRSRIVSKTNLGLQLRRLRLLAPDKLSDAVATTGGEVSDRAAALEAFVDLLAEKIAQRIGRTNSDQDVMNTKEVAEYMHASPAYVRTLVNNGELPAVKNGRSIRILKADVNGYLERKRG